MKHYIKIVEGVGIPKYKQVINSIKEGIINNKLQLGDKIHSINQLSKKYNLSRDTVKKAYNGLKSQNIIKSVKGKGFYIIKTDLLNNIRVLFLCDELNKFSSEIIRAFSRKIKEVKSTISIQIFHSDRLLLRDIIKNNLTQFDYLLVIPHCKSINGRSIVLGKDIVTTIKQIPPQKLIIIDKEVEDISKKVGRITFDYTEQIYQSLSSLDEKIKSFSKIILFLQKHSKIVHREKLLAGFRKYCLVHGLSHEVTSKINRNSSLQNQAVYLTFHESDMLELLTKIRASELRIGNDVGIITFDDNPYKELLGLTTIKRNSAKIGAQAAKMILTKKMSSTESNFDLMVRESV